MRNANFNMFFDQEKVKLPDTNLAFQIALRNKNVRNSENFEGIIKDLTEQNSEVFWKEMDDMKKVEMDEKANISNEILNKFIQERRPI